MKKARIQFTTSGAVVHTVAYDAYICEGCLWLDLSEDGLSSKVIPLHSIACVDFQVPTEDDDEVHYDKT